MKIRMLGNHGERLNGAEYELDDDEGRALVSLGVAREVIDDSAAEEPDSK